MAHHEAFRLLRLQLVVDVLRLQALFLVLLNEKVRSRRVDADTWLLRERFRSYVLRLVLVVVDENVVADILIQELIGIVLFVVQRALLILLQSYVWKDPPVDSPRPP